MKFLNKKSQKLIVKGKLLRRHGFSMIEVLIVIAIMATMTAALFSKQSGNKAQVDVEAAVRQVAAQIRALQNEALNGKRIDTNSDGVGDVSACRYVFDYAANATAYTVKYNDCSASPGTIINSGTQSIDLSKARVFFAGAAVNLYFSSPRGNVDSAKTVIIKSTIDNVCGSASISTEGVVTETKNVTCP